MSDDPIAAALLLLEIARANNDRVIADAATARAYETSLATIGRRPAIPAAVAAPDEPPSARPANVDAARTLLDQARTAGVLHAKATRDVEHAEQVATSARTARDAAKIEAARVVDLVAARRTAPTIAAQRKRARLGNLGDVDVIFHAETASGPVCEATVYGRSWDLASKGERVVADLILRCAARRESKMVGVPVVADDVGAWNGGAGPWPATGVGPVYWMLTTDEPLTISAGKPPSTLSTEVPA